MLPEDMFISLIATDLKDKIATTTEADELAIKIKDCLEKQLPPPMHTTLSDWSFTDSLIAYKGKIYILTNMELQKEIVTSFHDSLLAGHPGFFKMLHLIKEHYWWPGMTIFLKKYIDSCAICQQMKPNTHLTVAPLMPIKSHSH